MKTNGILNTGDMFRLMNSLDAYKRLKESTNLLLQRWTENYFSTISAKLSD